MLKLPGSEHEILRNAAGILDNSLAMPIQGVYTVTFNNMSKSQQELVSMNWSVSVGIAVSALG